MDRIMSRRNGPVERCDCNDCNDYDYDYDLIR